MSRRYPGLGEGFLRRAGFRKYEAMRPLRGRSPTASPSLFPLAPQVHDGICRITEQHPGPGIAHHRPDPLPHIGAVTVDGTGGTVRLVSPERTTIDSLQGIGRQFGAAGTQVLVPGRMMAPTVHTDHPPDYPPLISCRSVALGHANRFFVFPLFPSLAAIRSSPAGTQGDNGKYPWPQKRMLPPCSDSKVLKAPAIVPLNGEPDLCLGTFLFPGPDCQTARREVSRRAVPVFFTSLSRPPRRANRLVVKAFRRAPRFPEPEEPQPA